MSETLVKLFLPIIIGYILVKTKYLSENINRDLKVFVIRVSVPALVFINMYNTDFKTLKQLIPVASAYVILTVILMLLSFMVLVKVKDKRLKTAYIISIVWGNYGWMGWAVLNGVFGQAGFSRGVFFTALWWPILYLGSFLVSKLTKVNSALDVKNYIINMTVPTVALILGVIFNLLNIPLYEPLTYSLSKFGDMTVTIILFTVGLSISIRNSLKDLKMAIAPILLRPILGIIGGFITVYILGITDPISRGSILIESTMPVAVFTVVIGDMLGLDGKLMSSILILSTLLSLVTIPLTLLFF